MDYLLHIKPSFDCVLSYGNTQKSLIKNRIYTFILKEKTALTFYPSFTEELYSLPFSCVLQPSSNQIMLPSKHNLTLTRFPEGNFLLEVKPFIFASTSTNFSLKTKTINTCNTTHTISFFNNNMLNCRIENAKTYLDFSSPVFVTDMRVRAKNENILIYFKTQTQQFFTCHILYENNKYLISEMQEVDLLEESDNTITTYKNLKDFASHGEITTYSFSPNFVKSKELAYNNGKPFLTKVKEFVPFAFFEALNKNNFKLARHYMSPKLNKKLSNNHLKKFFGNFEKCHQTLSPEYNPEQIALIYNSTTCKYAKIFNIKFDENCKIENIEEN